ncbi:DUF5707 domain-containing protein [Streptomyces sp. NPDC058045]|uniref:DUF5707 domain-containing protein n=1 Tax=Streptomyces sp. NPDC058045 TaxID=3346311 RepID=UPI0036ECBB54
MRIRATMAAATVSGALALTAFVVPAAQADQAPGFHKPEAADRFHTAPQKARTALAADEPTIGKVTINGGSDIAVGTTNKKNFTVSVTASHPEGIADAYVDFWHGTNVESDIDGLFFSNEEEATCTATSATTSTCKLTFTVDPQVDLYKNALAGTWHVTVGALAGDGTSVYWNDFHTTARVQRYSKLTVNASPEPVKKGKTVTVVGKLSRANWEDHKYHGYTGQPVKLQFRKKTSTTYSTLKTIKSNSTGNLKTTSTATTSGYWRYYFTGTSTTPAVKAAGDYVAVK